MKITQGLGSVIDPHEQINTVTPKWDEKAAKWISRLFTPPLVTLAGLLYLTMQIGTKSAYLWLCFQLVLSFIIPISYLVIEIRRGNITNFHMRLREQRIRPMTVGLVCVTLAWVIMWVGSAPYALIVFAGIGILQTAFLLLVTLRWKISGHSMTIAGVAVFFYGTLGSASAPILLTIPLVAWARVRLSRHDQLQVLAGTTSGILFTLIGLYILVKHCHGINLLCQ